MSGIPVVISANGRGLPVKSVSSGAPVMTVAANGRGMPIVLSDRGIPFVVQGGTPAPSAPISAVAANGWSATMVSPADLALSPVTVSRQGFDATGAAATISDTFYTTKRVRQAYPNQASLTASDVALSDYVLSTDIIAGVTNNSTEISPKPIANWVMTSRKIVGNTLRLGVTGNHWAARNGKPFACVVFTVTDGTNTVTKTVTSMSVSTTGANDRFAVLAYEDDIDISSLNAGDITANAKVYPWIGGAASVQDSSLNSGVREFSPRVFTKDVAKAAAPNLIIVSSTGTDATAYVGTDPVAAAAAPALTLTGAINRARTVLGTTAGSLNGLRVQLTDGTWSLASNPTGNSVTAAVIIEPAPSATPANVILEFGAANNSFGFTYLMIRGGLTVRRMGAFYLYSSTSGFCTLSGVTFNPNGNSGSMSPTLNVYFFYDGVTFTANANSILNAGNNAQAMLRGVSVANMSGQSFESFLVLGCDLGGAGAGNAGSRSVDNSIVQFNRFSAPSASVAVINIGATATNVSVSQNLFEVTHTTTSTPVLRASSDSGTNNLTHVLFDNNTVASGHYQAGRCNMFYDETVGTVRTHKFCRESRTVAGGYYIKSDVFVGVNGNGTPNPADAPNHIGNWSVLYGVGNKGLRTLLVNAGSNGIGQEQGPAYAGLNGGIGTSQTVPQYSLAAGVTFTDWKATTTDGSSNAVAGAGGGTYSLPSGSGLLGIISAADEIFPRDLAGVLRDRGSVGAYA